MLKATLNQNKWVHNINMNICWCQKRVYSRTIVTIIISLYFRSTWNVTDQENLPSNRMLLFIVCFQRFCAVKQAGKLRLYNIRELCWRLKYNGTWTYEWWKYVTSHSAARTLVPCRSCRVNHFEMYKTLLKLKQWNIVLGY